MRATIESTLPVQAGATWRIGLVGNPTDRHGHPAVLPNTIAAQAQETPRRQLGIRGKPPRHGHAVSF
jgi:hypothetical protein